MLILDIFQIKPISHWESRSNINEGFFFSVSCFLENRFKIQTFFPALENRKKGTEETAEREREKNRPTKQTVSFVLSALYCLFWEWRCKLILFIYIYHGGEISWKTYKEMRDLSGEFGYLCMRKWGSYNCFIGIGLECGGPDIHSGLHRRSTELALSSKSIPQKKFFLNRSWWKKVEDENENYSTSKERHLVLVCR